MPRLFQYEVRKHFSICVIDDDLCLLIKLNRQNYKENVVKQRLLIYNFNILSDISA